MALPEEKNSWFSKPKELHGSIDNCNHTNLSQIISDKDDPYNNPSLNQHEKSEILLDPTLDYISRYLLEEDIDEKIDGYQEVALRDMEKPFYEILGEKYPPPQDNLLVSKQSKVNHPNFTTSILKDQVGPTFSESLEQHPRIENLIATEFQRGVEEGLKFLPNHNRMSINLKVSNLSLDPLKKWERKNSLDFRLGEENESGLLDSSKGKKSSNDSDRDLSEGRSRKIPMFSHGDQTIRDEMFDKVLLYHGENCPREEIASLREIKELEANSYSENQKQHDHINLTTLLISCAEAISMNDNKIASELIKQIRKEASPIGDGIQRLACIIVDGLEARLAGTGSATYRQYFTNQLHTIDYLKVYYMLYRVSEMRVQYHFANESILSAIGNASKIHVIDFGITFGFQWPSLIQSLAKRIGGTPKLRITGVDLPRPGFHPAERINETGRRLEDYARSFEVPFEYQAIASQWGSICVDDLSINDDEVLIFNTMYSLGRIKDEAFLDRNNPWNKLINLIQETKPKVFIQGIPNLSSTNPFFITRFRKVLFTHHAYFDMLDTLVPRDNKHRQVMEREIIGPFIINLIACEGSDLVVRPESYKQWHMRTLQTGLEQIPVDPHVVQECRKMLRNGRYNKEFFIEEDCNWFLRGWKGTIFYGISLWKPKVE